MAVNVYEDFDTESFIINNIKLRVNPTDVTLFADNAIYSETYLRSKAVFSFRSKYSREKVILTLPISISVTDATNDENAIASREDGLRLLSQLSNYPFCFVKSSRIKSYVAPLGGVSSTDFLMFGIQQLTLTQDMSMPDILFLEVHLVFNNFSPLIRDFKFKDFTGLTEYPSQSEMFNQAFAELETNKKDVNLLLTQLKALLNDSVTSGSAYVDGSLPYGVTAVLAPKISEEEENSLIENSVDYSTLLSETKTFEVTASDGTATYNADFLSAVDSEEPKTASIQKKKFRVAWTAPSDLSFGGVAALQRVRIVKYNKLARQYVSAHKHPILQYMGRQPSTVELVYKVNSSDIYKENVSSIVAAYSHLFNILDMNNLTYPEATAYNTLKIRSIAAQAIGLASVVPNQKHISSTSNEQGIETFSVSLVESDIEDFMKISKPLLGREVAGTSSSNIYKEAVVLAYLEKVGQNTGVVTSKMYSTKFLEVYNSDYKAIYEILFKEMANTFEAIISEFSGGAVGGKLVSKGTGYNQIGYVNNNFKNLVNNYTDAVTLTRDLKTVAIVLGAKIRERTVLKNSTKADLSKIAAKTSPINVEFEGQGTKTIIPADNYKRAGIADNSISVMFTQIEKLANLGDSAAKASLETHKADSANINDARVTSYTGSNFKEFNLSYLQAEGGGADPMYFVEPYYHMSSNDMFSAYKLVTENFKASVDDALASTSDLVNASSQETYNLITPVLTPSDIDEKAYTKEDSTGYHVDAMGRQSEGTLADSYEGTSGGNYGTISGSGSGKEFIDWNAKTGLSATQLRAKQAIIDTVKKNTRIESKDKANWTVFLIQLAGRESRLGEAISSGTGAKGLFQIVGGTASSLGYNNNSSDFNAATEAAIKYLITAIKPAAVKKGWTNWVHFYFLYNLGPTGGSKLLTSYYDSTPLDSAGVKQIDLQSDENVNSRRITNNRNLVVAYFNLVVNHFAPMNKHLDVKGNSPVERAKEKVDKNVGVKAEATKPITYSREDIQKNFVKVTYVEKPEEAVFPHSFFVSHNGKQYKIQIRDILCPYPTIPNRTMTMKEYNNRTVVYTRRPQPFGTDAMNKMVELTKNGFYVEKSALVSGSVGFTYAYNLNYQDIGKLMVEMGLSFAVNNTQYANIKSNFYLGRTKQDVPSTADSAYATLAKKYSEGDKSIRFEDFATKGYFKDNKEDFLTAERKITGAKFKPVVDVRPSSTVNTYLPFKNETGTVTGYFGEWRQKSGRNHFGIDSIPSGGAGNLQYAAAEGIVVQKGAAGSAGNRIRIWHPKIGFSTQYFHLKDFKVNQGDRVSAGQAIGTMGATGGDYGVHSHYQVGFGNAATGNLINPWKTTKLSLIPAYEGNALGLQTHAAKFLSNGFYLSHDNKDLRDTGKMYKGKGLSTDYFDNSDYNASTAGSTSTTAGVISTLKNATGLAKSRGIPKEFSVYNEDEIVKRQVANMLFPFRQGLNTSFPVMKAYITVGTDNEDLILNDMIRLAYYFEVDGLASVRVNCNNDDNPVDVMVLTVANPSFTATDNYAVTGKYLTTDMTSLYGPDEVEWVADRIKIKAGTKLHIRAGYGNNPNDLTTIFNGVVTQMSGEKTATLQLVCEGFGRELVSTQINPTKPEAAGGEWYNSSTSLIYSKCLLEDSIVHFGAKTSFLNTALAWLTPFSKEIQEDDMSDPEAKRLVTRFGANPFGDFGIHFTGGNLRQRLFSNIYSAEIDVLQPEFASSISNYLSNLLSLTEKSGYFYIFEGQTPWEAMKEMEYRHPGTRAKPLFFEDRMTMFFGLKEQMYIARDLDSAFMNSVASEKDDTITTEYLKQRGKRFDLVTRFHVATSANNIISNGLTLDSTFATGVDVLYFEDDDGRIEQKPDGLKSFRMSLDDDLNYWEYRYKTVSMPGTHGKYSSFMYGTTELRKQAEKMYGGKITLIGNPQIKAGDYMFIDDDTKKMTGIIKVRECIHHYTEEGFITEITPGLYIEASSFYYTTLFTRLGLTAQAAIALSNFSTETTALSNSDFNLFYKTFVESNNNSMLTNLTETAKNIIYNSGATPVAATALGGISMYTTLRTLHNLGLNSANTQAAYAYGSKAYSLAARTSASGYKSLTQTMTLFKNTKNGKKALDTFNNLKTTSLIIRGLANTAKASYWTAGRMLLVMGKIRRASAVLLAIGSKHPIGFLITVIGTFVYKYVEGLIQESMLTRQPLILFPINYFGRPYVAGISGYTVNSWLESKKSNFDRNLGYASKLVQEKRVVYPNSAFSTITGYFSNTGSYNENIVSGLTTVDDSSSTKSLGKK